MTDRDEIAYEQGYVDWVCELIDSMIERTQGMRSVANDRATYQALSRREDSKVEQLKNAKREVLFGRLDMESDETFYVGKHHVDGADSDEPAVIDWRTPIAELFYQASKSSNDGVGRVRTITVRHQIVTNVSDNTLVKGFKPPLAKLRVPAPPSDFVGPEEEIEQTLPDVELAESGAEPELDVAETDLDDEWTPATDIDELIADEHETSDEALATPDEPLVSLSEIVSEEYDLRSGDILLEELEKGRSGEMSEIVATIQADQDRLIRSDPEKSLVIQGGPGTGKTVVALHRAAWVLYKQRENSSGQSVLVVGPNRRFLSYIKSVLPSLGESTSTQNSVDDLMLSSLTASERQQVQVRRTESESVARIKGDSRMTEVVARAVWSNVAPRQIEVGFGRYLLRLDINRVEDLIERNWFANLAYDEARLAFRDQVLDALTQELIRRRNGMAIDADTGTQLAEATRRELTQHRILETVFPRVSPRVVVRRLMIDPEFRSSAATEILRPDEIEILGTGASGNRYRWSSSDLALIDQADFVIHGYPQQFPHVVVDEAQDLSPLQWKAVRRRCRGGSLTISGDLAQSTSAWTPTSWDDVKRWGELDSSVAVSELQIGYRVTMPIMEYAGRLLPLVAPTIELPQSFRPGSQPQVFKVQADRLIETAVETVHGWLGSPGTTAVIVVPEMYDQTVTALADVMNGGSGPDEDGGSSGVEVIVDDGAKGLEFDRVVVVEPDEIARGGATGLRRLYICLTRATKELAVIHCRPIPEVLGLPEVDRSEADLATLRSKVRERRLSAPAGSVEWRTQVSKEYPHAYRRWTDEEEVQLRTELDEGLTIDEIAERHLRRVGGIKSRIRKLGWD